MKWALLSVWDKSGIVELAHALTENKYNILSFRRNRFDPWRGRYPFYRSIELYGFS